MLDELAGIIDGFAVDQRMHCLQTATRAERGGADDEMIVASFCLTTSGRSCRLPIIPASPPRSSSRM